MGLISICRIWLGLVDAFQKLNKQKAPTSFDGGALLLLSRSTMSGLDRDVVGMVHDKLVFDGVFLSKICFRRIIRSIEIVRQGVLEVQEVPILERQTSRPHEYADRVCGRSQTSDESCEENHHNAFSNLEIVRYNVSPKNYYNLYGIICQ